MNWSSPSLNSRHLFAADERPQVARQGVDVDAQIRRARAIDVDAQLRLRRLEVRVGVDDAVDRAHLLDELNGVRLQLLDIRPLNQDVQPIRRLPRRRPHRRLHHRRDRR